MTYSDTGEDDYILRQFPEGYIGTAVDVGAGDGKTISNTLLLEEKGWNVLCIEPNPDFEQELKALRKNVVMSACLAQAGEEDFYSYHNPGGLHREVVATVGPLSERFREMFCGDASREPTIRKAKVSTLNELLAGWEHRDPIDFISIDVDGREHEVLAGLDFNRWRPRMVLIEDVGLPEQGDWLTIAMRQRGYMSVGLFGWNVLWVSHEMMKEALERSPGRVILNGGG